jgi:hypothetical protein
VISFLKKIEPLALIAGIGLLFYWPTLFIVTHMTLPSVVYQAGVSDKALHFISFFLLFLLVWLCLANGRVNWKQPRIYYILITLLIYSALDEWLQGFVGRSTDIKDWYADSAGIIFAAFLFTLLSLRPALCAATAFIIVFLTNIAKHDLSELVPVINSIFHFTAHAVFCLTWIWFISSKKNTRCLWLIAAAGPVALILFLRLLSTKAAQPFTNFELLLALSGAATAYIISTALKTKGKLN